MGKPTLEFWYDFASTYSYLSAMRIKPLAERAGVEVLHRPFLLGPIFKAQGWASSPFNVYPAKGRYMIRDMERLAAERGLVFHSSDPFPQNSLGAARVALVALEEGWIGQFTPELFKLEFGERCDISAASTLEQAVRRAGEKSELSLDFARVFERSGADDIKRRLRAQTEAAAVAQIFGAPTFRTADGELFWGDDRLDQAVVWARKL
ncbi:MAG: 2-hydroxychromene-2-carboxylate isomerase [Hyphomicrobiaceae bacterium]